MQSIPYRTSETEWTMFVILEDDNLERMKRYDPAEIFMDLLPPEWDMKLKLKAVVIGYANRADLDTVHRLFQNGDLAGALKFLSRGYQFRPDKGDREGEYESIRPERQ